VSLPPPPAAAAAVAAIAAAVECEAQQQMPAAGLWQGWVPGGKQCPQLELLLLLQQPQSGCLHLLTCWHLLLLL
jgi:hypothetical protein